MHMKASRHPTQPIARLWLARCRLAGALWQRRRSGRPALRTGQWVLDSGEGLAHGADIDVAACRGEGAMSVNYLTQK